MKWNSLIMAALAALLLAAPAPVSADGEARDAAVVELFMSQGCAACPPAVDLFGELAGRDDIIALTWAVDYWDHGGWKDTFATPRNTKRQRAYNDHLGLRYLFTPQIFVNGASQVVGSDRGEVMTALAEPAKRLRVKVAIEQTGARQVTVRLPEAPSAVPATIWLVRYDHHETVGIAAGENAGKTLALRNVVRDSTEIGTWDGTAMTIALDIPELTAGDGEACAILVQTAGTGPIIGAAILDFASLASD